MEDGRKLGTRTPPLIVDCSSYSLDPGSSNYELIDYWVKNKHCCHYNCIVYRSALQIWFQLSLLLFSLFLKFTRFEFEENLGFWSSNYYESRNRSATSRCEQPVLFCFIAQYFKDRTSRWKEKMYRSRFWRGRSSYVQNRCQQHQQRRALPSSYSVG